MKFAVIGMGRTGHTMTCYLLNKGQEVIVWDRNKDKLALIEKKGITITGAIDKHFSPKVAFDIKQAVKDADYILVMTTADGHESVAKLLHGLLRLAQRILIFNCNWGAYVFFNELASEIKKNNILVGETCGMLLMSPTASDGNCYLKAIKSKLQIATIPSNSCNKMIDELKDVFPQFYPGKNVIETSMSGANPIIHSAINMFNLSTIENGKDFLMYADASTQQSVKLAEKIDGERLTVMNALNITSDSVADNLSKAWGKKGMHLYNVLHETKSYKTAKGPNSFEHRHFTEDIPFGLVPISKIGKIKHIPTPTIDLVIKSYETFLDKDYTTICPSFTEADLARLEQG